MIVNIYDNDQGRSTNNMNSGYPPRRNASLFMMMFFADTRGDHLPRIRSDASKLGRVVQVVRGLQNGRHRVAIGS